MAARSSDDQDDGLAVRPGRAAELLDVSRATIYNLIARGELSSFLIGRSRRISVQAIEQYIVRQQEGGVAS